MPIIALNQSLNEPLTHCTSGTRAGASPADSRSLEKAFPDLFVEANSLPALARNLFCPCSAKYSRYPCFNDTHHTNG